MIRWFTPLLALALAVPAGAQQWQVAREQFAFAGRQLTVHVEVEAEGTLRIIRGASGAVRISGQSGAGLTAAGLTADEHLTLTAAGEGPVEYVVAVPERVWIDVLLPDRDIVESMGGQERTRTFHWGAAVDAGEEREALGPAAAPQRRPRTVVADGFTALANGVTPDIVSLPDLSNVRSITVRVEGSVFRVSASRPLVLAPGDPRHLEIRPAGPPMEIAVVVPAGTGDFTLSAGGDQALRVSAGEIAVLCGPSTRQWLPGDRGWVTFTPVQGALECGARPPRGIEVERRTSITATGTGS